MNKTNSDKEVIIGVSSLNYKDNKSMDLKKAEIEASKLANITGVNHVIVLIGNTHSVYTEKQYPSGYLTLVKPEIKIESIIEETKPKKVKVNVSKEA